MSEFEILCVCTGNVCRSPVAERLLGRVLEPLGVRVTSAGTDAPVGAHIAPQMDELLLASGVDASDHRARWLTEADVLGADLVLGMTRHHRGRSVELAPAALRRSFTLLGLAAIASQVPADELERAGSSPSERLRGLVQMAPRYRHLVGNEDIDDPIGRDEATYTRVFDEIQTAVSSILTAVTGER